MSLHEKQILLSKSLIEIRTLGPQFTTSDLVAKEYLSKSYPNSKSHISLHNSFEDARTSLKPGEYLLIPSAYRDARNFFFDKELILVDSFTDRSVTYYLAGADDSGSGTLYIHNATRALADDFILEASIEPTVVEVSSTSLAAQLAAEGKEMCIANDYSISKHRLKKFNDGFNFTMTWNLFADTSE